MVVYSTDPEAAAEQELARFHALFPKIRPNYLRLQAGALYARLLAERQGKVYLPDVTQLADMSFALDFQKRGGYMQYVSPEMAAYKPEYKSSARGLSDLGRAGHGGNRLQPESGVARRGAEDLEGMLDPKWTDAITVKVTTSGLQHVELVHAATALRRRLLVTSSPR